MSPEQATAQIDAIDHHVDQWALACIAWEMLLGTPPFVAEDVTALLHRIVKMEPHPLTPHLPGLPPTVEVELRRALSKRPADRFPTIRDFARAFESAAFGRPADSTPPPVLVSAMPDRADIGYAETESGGTPDARPVDLAPQEERESGAATAPIRARRWNRIKPIHATVGAALLLLGAFFLFRSCPAPTPVTPKTNTPVTPSITAPSSPTTPAAAAIAPKPTEAEPVGSRPEPSDGKRIKVTPPADTSGRERVTRPTAPSSRPAIKRRLIQKL
jgi:serine/threonine-protein kinase